MPSLALNAVTGQVGWRILYVSQYCPLVLGALLGLTLAWPAGAAVVSHNGTAVTSIVVPRDATEAEQTAASELATYLGRATSLTFDVFDEGAEGLLGPAIYVGPTDFAAAAGIDVGGSGREDWRIRTLGPDVILVGGRPRGTLYAVYRFLEDYVGVRWWTPFEETVPARPDLSIPEIDDRGRPAFVYRDVLGIGGGRRFGRVIE